MTPTPSTRARLRELDQLRALAILVMVVDHIALLAGAEPIRWTIGRVAMPVFFLVAGSLVTHLTWRHAWVLVVGGALPWVVPWIDRPNVLAWYVLGSVVLVAGGRTYTLIQGATLRSRGRGTRLEPAAPPAGAPSLPRPYVWAVLVVCLALLANGWSTATTGYAGAGLVAMLAAGNLLGPVSLARVGRHVHLGPLEVSGRYPLTFYVTHLLALEAARRLLT